MISTAQPTGERSILGPLSLIPTICFVMCLLSLPVPASASQSDDTRPWPTTPVVMKEFDPPWPDWLPGHRGLDLQPGSDDLVRTPASGSVAWRGQVGGTPVLVIAHGVARATYQPVTSDLRVGTSVSSGQVIGRMSVGGHCREDCLHWGLKVDDRYLDPRMLLQRLYPVLVGELPARSR